MRTIILIIIAILVATPVLAKTVGVKPHITKHGVYVPHSYRTSPDKTKMNNYSTKGNVNPYTGKAGTVDPYKASKSYR